MSEEQQLQQQDDENSDNTQVQVLNALKLPIFLQSDPELWFTQVDAILHLNRFTSDVSKYYTVITALDAETMRQISDIAKSPPEKNKYETLKKELIRRFSESKEKQLSKLLLGLELGCKRPSQLLREMRELAGANVSLEGLQTLWLQRLPSNIRCILTACKAENLESLADIADRIQENTATSPLTIAATSHVRKNDSDLASRVLALEVSVQQLIQKFAESDDNRRDSRQRNRYHGDQRHSSRRRSSSHDKSTQKICYYHIKFGKAANKCQKPCDYPAENPDQGN